MVGSFYISLTKWNHLTAPVFVGISNYRKLFSDAEIGKELLNTLFFVITLVPLTIVFSLFLANTLNKKSPLTGFFRAVFFVPYVILPVVSALVWLIMFNSRFGLINQILHLLGLPQPVWNSGQITVRCMVIVVSLWATIGHHGVIILAGLQNIPAQYYEACELEGGTGWHKFFHITVPLITPQLFFVVVITNIAVFQMFDYVFVFGKTNVFVKEQIKTMAFGIYERGFTFLDMGYASAEAVIFCAMIMGVTILQNIFQRNWVYYE
jgi:multiple sugar transport system permease protein